MRLDEPLGMVRVNNDIKKWKLSRGYEVVSTNKPIAFMTASAIHCEHRRNLAALRMCNAYDK